jgi:hypothetical protein
MRSIAERLFGRDAGRLLDLILSETPEENGAASRVRDAGGWCETTPDSVPAPGPFRRPGGHVQRGPLPGSRHWHR